ncbi:HAUS augmin-like complex subunit 4 isoform X2 [Tiliqua scincoides]|uniref:HAUS augmin-like complex subunit 4 isoform X2 n=1 Tax=Tiliqua scincoides TaxID=71010 RepID=UPI003461AA16
MLLLHLQARARSSGNWSAAAAATALCPHHCYRDWASGAVFRPAPPCNLPARGKGEERQEDNEEEEEEEREVEGFRNGVQVVIEELRQLGAAAGPLGHLGFSPVPLGAGGLGAVTEESSTADISMQQVYTTPSPAPQMLPQSAVQPLDDPSLSCSEVSPNSTTLEDTMLHGEPRFSLGFASVPCRNRSIGQKNARRKRDLVLSKLVHNVHNHITNDKRFDGSESIKSSWNISVVKFLLEKLKHELVSNHHNYTDKELKGACVAYFLTKRREYRNSLNPFKGLKEKEEKKLRSRRYRVSLYDKGPMASVSGTVGAELLQQGRCSCLPPCSLTDEDLAAYPGLANLLMCLNKHMDSSGLNIGLVQQMEEAKKELHLHKANWLKWETIYRLLQEALRELGTELAPQDRKFLEILEQQLLVTEMRQILDVGHSLQGTQTSLLGLVSSDLLELLPSNQELEQIRKHLPVELEKRLKPKCMSILSYYHPESDGVGESVRVAMLGTLAERLAAEKQRLREAHARHQELVGLLEQQKATYPQALQRCILLLKRLAHKHRLGTQSELDCLNTQYLEIKCSAMFLKIRLEELSVLLETYTPEKLDVHRTIRDNLQAALCREKEDLVTYRKILSDYETLGPEFEELVKEYARLQDKIANFHWMLTEINKH